MYVKELGIEINNKADRDRAELAILICRSKYIQVLDSLTNETAIENCKLLINEYDNYLESVRTLNIA